MSKAALLCCSWRGVRVWLACAALCALSAQAEATIMRYLEVEELARLSTDVIHGEIISTKVFWDETHTRIYTSVRVRIHETFKGTAQRGATVTVTQQGGELDGLRQDYSGRPVFTAGETVVLFTKPGRNHDLTVVGLKQGKLRVNGDEVLRDFNGITLLDELPQSKTAGRANAASKPMRVQTRLTLGELRARLAKL